MRDIHLRRKLILRSFFQTFHYWLFHHGMLFILKLNLFLLMILKEGLLLSLLWYTHQEFQFLSLVKLLPRTTCAILKRIWKQASQFKDLKIMILKCFASQKNIEPYNKRTSPFKHERACSFIVLYRTKKSGSILFVGVIEQF